MIGRHDEVWNGAPEMTEVTMELRRELLRHCVGLGLVACRLPSMHEASLEIFEAVKVAAPDCAAWIIGVGMVHANARNDPDEACAFMMKQRISAGTGDLLARAYLSLFLVMANRNSEAERVAMAVVADGSDEDAARLARSLLDNEIRKH